MRFTCVATIGDPAEARVAAARLQHEGLTVRVHGEADGPFPVTVGPFAATQLWVAADEADAATAVLADIGVVCTPWDAEED